MKSILKLCIPAVVLLLILSFCSGPVNGMVMPKQVSFNTTPASGTFSPFRAMTVREFLALTPVKYRQMTGNKMSFTQKVSLKFAQRKVKKLLKNNKRVDLMFFAKDIDTNNFDIPGFILGIALGPLGMLIAYLIEGRNSSMFRWALYGAILWVGIFLLVVLIL